MTNTPKDVEAVARALCIQAGGDPDSELWLTTGADDEDYAVLEWHEFTSPARAAIQAHTVCLMEPATPRLQTWQEDH